MWVFDRTWFREPFFSENPDELIERLRSTLREKPGGNAGKKNLNEIAVLVKDNLGLIAKLSIECNL